MASNDTMTARPPISPEDQRLVEYVMDRMAASERHDRPFKDRALEHWKHVNSTLPAEYPFYSRYFEPETQIAANDVLESILGSVFQKEQTCDLEPEDGQGDVETEMFRATIEHCHRERINYKRVKYFQFQECVIFGNGVEKHTVELHWDVQRKVEPVLAGYPYPVQIGRKETVVKRPEFWPSSSVVSRFDCYPAPTGSDIQAMPYFIERCILPVDTAKARGQRAGWRNLDRIIPFYNLSGRSNQVVGTYDDSHWDMWERFKAVGFDVTSGDANDGDKNSIKYCELLIYCEAPPDGRGCSRIIVIANRDTPLLNIANPYRHGLKPYSDIKFQPYGDSYWQAKGVAELIFDIQRRLNDRVNAASDIMESIRNPMTLVGRTCTIRNLSSLTPTPGAIVRVGDVNAVQWREFPRVPAEIWNDITLSRVTGQRVTNSPDYTKGIAGTDSGLAKGTETASGMAMLMNAASSAKTFKWLLNEELGIREGLKITGSNIQQYLSDVQKVRILGENKVLTQAGFEKFIEVTPEDIAGGWVYYPVGASRSKDPAAQAQINETFFTRVAQTPEGSRLKWPEIVRDAAELIGIKNYDRYRMSDEELAEKIQREGDPAQQMFHMKLLEGLARGMRFADLPPSIRMQLEQWVGFKPASPSEELLTSELTHLLHPNRSPSAAQPQKASQQ